MALAHIPTYYGEPSHWSGSYDSKPTPAPVYGKALDRNGSPLELDSEVIVHLRWGGSARRAKVVGIGDQGLPDNHIAKVREHGSAYISSATPTHCEPHEFDAYDWLKAEEAAALSLAKKGIDLERCMFGGFYFDMYQRAVMAAYLATRVQVSA